MASLEQNKYLGRQLTRVLLTGNIVRAQTLIDLHQSLSREGLRIARNEACGPSGGRQLVYRKDGVVVRIKTLGDEKGDHANQPHLTIGLVDENQSDLQTERGKFTAAGNLTDKSITTPQQFNAIDEDGNPQQFVVTDDGQQDSPANEYGGLSTHFALPTEFDASGAERLIPLP